MAAKEAELRVFSRDLGPVGGHPRCHVLGHITAPALPGHRTPSGAVPGLGWPPDAQSGELDAGRLAAA